MNIVVKSALAGAALVVAYACANPVDIEGDVLRVDPSAFGDAGVLLGGAAGSAGVGGAAQGGTGPGTGGTSSSTGGTGSALGGTGGTGMQAGLSGAGGVPIGAGGTLGAGTGGTAPAGGTGGAAAGAGGGAGTGGTGGTGGTDATGTFDSGSCDFEDLAGCEDLTCETVCPTNDGGSCLNRCVAVIDCVAADVAANPAEPCVTEADPLCGVRAGGQPNTCTNVVEPAGGPNPAAPTGTGNPQPSFVARQLVECVCTTPRP